jgi:hypothetical protein
MTMLPAVETIPLIVSGKVKLVSFCTGSQVNTTMQLIWVKLQTNHSIPFIH